MKMLKHVKVVCVASKISVGVDIIDREHSHN